MNLFRNSLGPAACVALLTLAVLLLAPSAEASRGGQPAALAPALEAPATPDQVLDAELTEPPERLRIFEDLRLPPRPLELVEAQKTASGSSTYTLGLNVWQTGDLSQECSGLSFQGLWTDPVTGIAYARNRWYDARTASWLSEDPKGAVDSPNLYAFVGWGPHVATDPMGMRALDEEDLARLARAQQVKDMVRMELRETGTFSGQYLPPVIRESLAAQIGLTGKDELTRENYHQVLALIDIEAGSYRTAVAKAGEGQPVVPTHPFFRVPFEYNGEWITPIKWRPGVTDQERERNYKIGLGIMLVTEEIPMMFAGRLRQPGQPLVEARPAPRKRGPKPKGTGPHNLTIERRIEELKKEFGPKWEHIGGGIRLKEEYIRTPGGEKSARRPDITFWNRETGEIYRENVGRTYKRTGEPYKREVDALNDLETVGPRPAFKPYDP